MSDPSRWSARRPILLGLLALAVLVGGLGMWSSQVSIAGAVIAPGIIEVEGNRQPVQHPDGGVVGDILVDEGEVLARKARLTAERDGAAEVRFPADLVATAASDATAAEVMAGEARLFAARAETLAGAEAQLGERIRQIEAQVEGTTAQIAALEEQRRLIAEERADQQSLLDRGLTQADVQNRVLAGPGISASHGERGR